MHDIFEKDMLIAQREFPAMQIVGNPGNRYLKGILNISDKEGNNLGQYLVEIRRSLGYPFAYPRAYEIGGDIPIGADYHKYSDNSLCLDVAAHERIVCNAGLDICRFIKDVLIPHLANQLYKKITGQYADEYSHGADGVREFYTELCKSDKSAILRGCYNYAFGGSKIGRNELCFCGSQLKYKRCHEEAINALQIIGRKQVIMDFKEMRLL